MAILVCTFNPVTGQLLAQTIGAAQITAGAIGTAQIAAGAILSSQLGSGQMGAIHVGTFTSGQVIIGQGTATPVYGFPPGGTIGDNTITSAKIASGQVGDGHLYPGLVVSGKIGANIIATPHIQNQGILSASVGAAVLGGVHIAAGTILSGNYASGSINGVMIANASILSSDIGANVMGPPLFERFSSGKVITGQGTGADYIYRDQQAAIPFVIDGGGSVITVGLKGYIEVPFPGVINRCSMFADQSGGIIVDILKQTYASYPPVSGTGSICSGRIPIISGTFKYQDSTLTGWVRAIASGDILAFQVNSAVSSVQLCTVSLGVYR